MGCKVSKSTGRVGRKSLREGLMWQDRPGAFASVYESDQQMGEGSMGSVRRVVHRTTGRQFACKTIMLNRVTAAMRDELRNEINILSRLDHPCIIRPLETFHEKRQIYFVMELCTGGDLYDRRYTEEKAIRIMKKVCHAIAYCHSRNVVHRDIKFENIMFENNEPDSEVKLIDFGLSKIYSAEKKMMQVVGTPYSIAPEVMSGDGYTEKSDVWSLGVIAYMMLTGNIPFDGTTEDEIAAKAKRRAFDVAPLRRHSPQAREFVDKCLVVSPEERWTAEDALNCGWLVDVVPDDKLDASMAPEIVQSISRFGRYSRLKKTALMVAAHRADGHEIRQLRRAFMAIDTANEGYITLEEFHHVLQEHMPHDAGMQRVEELFDGMDQDQTGKIHYMEFLAATLEASEYHREETLLHAFDRLDSDNSGAISRNNLKQLLGKEYDSETVSEMIKDGDVKNNGKIEQDEFLTMMRRRRPSLESMESGLETFRDEAKENDS